jgi:hypothetical protein
MPGQGVTDAFDMDSCTWIKLACSFDSRFLGRFHGACSFSTGSSHCVVALRPSLDIDLVVCHRFELLVEGT